MPMNPDAIKKLQKKQRRKLHEDMRQMLSQFKQKDTQPTEYANAMQLTDHKMDEDLQGKGNSSIAGDTYVDTDIMTGPGMTYMV